jgi:hypothetical protein
MANAATQPEVSPGFRTSITRSLFSARHDLDGDRTRNMMPLIRIATVQPSLLNWQAEQDIGYPRVPIRATSGCASAKR